MKFKTIKLLKSYFENVNLSENFNPDFLLNCFKLCCPVT